MAKPKNLIGCVMSWPIAVGARLPDGTYSIMDSETWVLDIPELTNADKRHELHARLRSMVVFNFGLLYWQFRDWGLSVNNTKYWVERLVRSSSFAQEVSYKGAMQDMKELIPTLYGVDFDEFRARKRAENIEATRTRGGCRRLLKERRRILISLCRGLNQARRHEDLVNKLARENVRKGKFPAPLSFMASIAVHISAPVSPQQLVDIAVLGRVNPARLWPQFQHAHDLFEVMVFAGDRLMAVSTPATAELRDTYRRDVVGEGSLTPCKAAARPNRAWFADAASTVFKRPALALAVRDLRAV